MSDIVVNKKFNLAHEFSTLLCLAVPTPFQKRCNFHIIVTYSVNGVSELLSGDEANCFTAVCAIAVCLALVGMVALALSSRVIGDQEQCEHLQWHAKKWVFFFYISLKF